MVDGLWIVEFTAPSNLFGTGILVLSKNRLLGGDAGYYYSGSYKISNSNISASVEVIRFQENSISVFGDIPQFSLEFSGELKQDEFAAVGFIKNMPQQKIHIRGMKKEEP